MEITAITRQKGSRFRVEVDGEYWYIFDREIIEEKGLHTGLRVDEAFLASVREAADRRRARERALYLIEYRAHGKQELYEKLKKSVSPEIAADTVNRMEELGLLDDAAYAARLADQLLRVKKRGARRAAYEMRQRGLPRELVEQAISAVTAEQDPVETVVSLIKGKYAARLAAENGKQRVVQALLRQGFDYTEIRTAFGRVEEGWYDEL